MEYSKQDGVPKYVQEKIKYELEKKMKNPRRRRESMENKMGGGGGFGVVKKDEVGDVGGNFFCFFKLFEKKCKFTTVSFFKLVKACSKSTFLIN